MHKLLRCSQNITNRLLAFSPDLFQSWALIVIIYPVCVIVGGIPSAIVMKITGAATPEWAVITSNVLQYIVLALIIIRLGKGSEYVPVESQRQSPLLWLLLIPFTLSVSLAARPLTTWIPMPDIIKVFFANAFTNSLSTFLSVVVIAPICEEWLFRGIILKGLLKRYSPLKAILWSAVIFGVFHLNPWQAVTGFCIGMAMGWIYWRTRSLWYCIFMHAVNNAVMFLAMFLFNDLPDDTTLADLAGGYYIYAVVLLVCALTGIWIKNIISSDTTADTRS
jgi:membrane protease YdiL (CAAX protease family)